MINKELWQDSLKFARELMTILPNMPQEFKNLGQANTFKTKERGEKVGKYDLFVQDYLIKHLTKFVTPGVLIASEEIASAWPPEANEYWAIDPIDGTHNMAIGMPLHGTMGAFIQDDKIMFSFVYLPSENPSQLYFASRGNGTWTYYNNTGRVLQLKVSNQNDFDKATIFVEGSIRHAQHPAFILCIMKNHRTRNLCASCWSGTRVALGNALPISVDALVISGVKPFDSLPIALLVEEAGGQVTDFYGNPYSPTNFKDLIMSNGILHKNILKMAKHMLSFD